MAQPELLRLQRIVVDRLFDIYDHDISLNLEDRVTLLHGPNGVGKTVVLGMINALLRERLDYFWELPFSRFLLAFHDGSTVQLKTAPVSAHNRSRYILELSTNGSVRSAHVSGISRADKIAERIDHLRPHGEIPQAWVDMRDGEVLHASEVTGRYSEVRTTEQPDEEDTSWFGHFLRSANAHFIETQRLVRIDWDASSRLSYLRGTHRRSMISTVVECSEHFKERLADTMVQYGRESQKIDQLFPQRLIGATEELPDDRLQTEMSILDQKAADLKDLGILDEAPAHPFSVASLGDSDHTERRVMTLYVRNTARKLQVLDDLAARARVLLDNVNQKYRHKRIELDRDHGFIARSDSGQLLPLRSLSSGEQQELVLHYDLLFRVRSNTIVLIDEPELSLHVAWQKRFLPDLLKIVRLSNFDALVATHSPYVVGERTDLMTGLGEFT